MAAASERLPGTYLGSREQFGSVDSWTIEYSIEQCGDEWIVYFKIGTEENSTGSLTPAQLAVTVEEAGIDTEAFVDDLRKAGLAALADEIEAAPDTSTYVDDSGVRYYRHPPAPVRAFEAVLNIRDRADNLTIGTPDGIHEIGIEIRAHRQDGMQPVLRVRGQATPDGQLQVIVTNVLTGKAEVINA
jgi:hypothetical protein